MNSLALLSSTGNEQVDQILRGFVGLCELAFPGRVRGYYLTGSWINGTALLLPGDPDNSSDLDLRVIFKGTLEEPERRRFDTLAAACLRISPLRLEVYPTGEEVLTRNWDVCLKQESLLLFGEDIRDRLPLPDLDDYIQRTMTFPPYAMAAVRGQVLYADGQWRKPLLRCPLSYPDPDGEFRGYEVVSSLGELVGDATWAATVILALKAGLYAGTKWSAARMYREQMQDEWSDLPAAVFEKCKLAWRHQIPAGDEDRKQLRELCRRMLGLENYLLQLCREYLIAALASEDHETVLYAVRMLGMLVYDDAAILAALRGLADSEDPDLRSVAQRTLGRMGHSPAAPPSPGETG